MWNTLNKFYLVVSLLLIALLFYYHFKDHKKLGYVTTAKVYQEFVMKKELEKDYQKVQIARQSYLDSMKLAIQMVAMKGQPADKEREGKLEEYKRAYMIREDQFKRENENLSQQYSEQIWKQLNQYMEDFGKENGYDYLLGASGQGSIMYASEKEDVTKQVTDYVNEKYYGKKGK